ncbi:MAG: hypothetical protein KGH75_07895 [Rhodospirillales bacterium]|nr:hypothetical protein [Rhodospirillales bacterium]
MRQSKHATATIPRIEKKVSTMMSFLRLFRKDRRGATAVAMAIMFVPLVIAASAAVDISRAVSARSQMQAATDAAAIAGAGAWQTSESSSVAFNTTTVAYNGTAAHLTNFVSGGTPTVELTCTGTTTQCGQSQPYATSTSTYNCPTKSEYCVVISTSGTLQNSLFRFLIPSKLLNVRSVAATPFPAETISGRNIPPSPGLRSAGDVSGFYAYAVPMNANGTPNYAQTPTPNSACSNYGTIGPLALLSSSSTTGSACNYLFIALSTTAGTGGQGGSLTLQQNQPVAFRFVNYTGANGYHSGNYYQTNTQLYVSTSSSSTGNYNQNGYQAPIYTTSTYSCSKTTIITSCATNVSATSTNTASTGTTGTNSSCYTQTTGSGKKKITTYYCTTSVVTLSYSAPLKGQCPDSTLYGSLDPLGSINSSTGTNSAEVPSVDSLNSYSSAYEIIGYPPTYEANHALVPFVATSLTTTQNVAGQNYYVSAICPNYTTSGTDVAGKTYNSTISAQISAAYSKATGWNNLNIFSTAFPGQNYGDSSSTNSAAAGTVNPAVDNTNRYYTGSIAMTSDAGDIYPPTITACTPATNTSDGGVTTTPSAWWNWHNDNTGNCGNESTTNRGRYVSTPGQPQYSNCSLVIQSLGAAVPTNSNNQALLPDYYLVVTTPAGAVVGLDPVWDGQTFADVMPGVIVDKLSGNDLLIRVAAGTTTVKDSDLAPTYTYNSTTNAYTAKTYGFTPSSTNSYIIPTGTPIYGGDTVTIEQPVQSGAGNYDFDLPPNTSYRCYNPQANGNAAHTAAIQNGTSTPSSFAATGDQNNGTAVDPIANPQLGAILCNSDPPETYALYWNDLGTYESDDVGYWNAIIAFTCSVPSSTTAGGGPVTLSG